MSKMRTTPQLVTGVISTTTGNDSYVAVNVDGYLSLSLSMVSNSASGLAVIFEVSNDAVADAYTGNWDGVSGTWKALAMQRSNSSTAESTLTINADTAYSWVATLGYRWFRVRCTSVTSGSTTWYAKPQYKPIAYLPNTSSILSGGQATSGSPVSGAPVRIAGQVRTSNYSNIGNGNTGDVIVTGVGAMIIKPFSIPENDWNYSAGASGISNTTTAVTIKTASGAGIRNYITSIQLFSEALGTTTEFVIRDGAGGTVLWRQKIGTTGLTNGINIIFNSPLKSTANTLLEVATLTASVTGAVYFNAQGYTAP